MMDFKWRLQILIEDFGNKIPRIPHGTIFSNRFIHLWYFGGFSFSFEFSWLNKVRFACSEWNICLPNFFDWYLGIQIIRRRPRFYFRRMGK